MLHLIGNRHGIWGSGTLRYPEIGSSARSLVMRMNFQFCVLWSQCSHENMQEVSYHIYNHIYISISSKDSSEFGRLVCLSFSCCDSMGYLGSLVKLEGSSLLRNLATVSGLCYVPPVSGLRPDAACHHLKFDSCDWHGRSKQQEHRCDYDM